MYLGYYKMGTVIMGIRCSIYDSGWLCFIMNYWIFFFFLSLIGAFYIYYKTKVFNFLLTSFEASTIFHITNFFFFFIYKKTSKLKHEIRLLL